MAFKRKRSDDDSPLSVSSWGAASTPEAQSPIPFPQCFGGLMEMDVDAASRQNGWDFATASRVKGSDWGNRTRKRFRDNRPDERAIHGMPSYPISMGIHGTDQPQKTHYKSSSPLNATTLTSHPHHPTPYQPTNLSNYRSHKSRHCIPSGNSFPRHLFKRPSSPLHTSRSSPNHAARTVTHHFKA